MSNFKKTSLLLITFFFLNSCSGLQNLMNIEKPGLSISDVRVTGFSLSDVELTFDVDIDNPNPVSLTLQSFDYNFDIADNSFISGTQESNTSVGASQTSTVSIPVTFTFQELYNTFQTVRSQDETSYSFLANAQLSLPVLGMVNVPVERTGVFPVVKLPSVSVAGFKIDNLSFTRADVSLDLRVQNPNAFGMALNSMNYSLNINGFSPLDGQVSQSVMIPEKSSGTVTIPVSFNLAELGIGAYRILTGNEPLNYSLSGTANVGAELPFFEASDFDFDRSGTVNINR